MSQGDGSNTQVRLGKGSSGTLKFRTDLSKGLSSSVIEGQNLNIRPDSLLQLAQEMVA
jgi:hypothetical protein